MDQPTPERQKEIIEEYIDRFIEEKLPEAVNKIIDERIREENLRVYKKMFEDPLGHNDADALQLPRTYHIKE